MNGYICFFAGRRWETHAATQSAARLAAVAYFKPSKSRAHMVHAHLAEVDGKPYVHVADV